MSVNEILNAKAHILNAQEFVDLGKQVGQLYTAHGLPIDMSLDRLEITEEAKLLVLDGACQWLIEHKRNSGATEKAIERQRKANRQMIADFLRTGEVGVY